MGTGHGAATKAMDTDLTLRSLAHDAFAPIDKRARAFRICRFDKHLRRSGRSIDLFLVVRLLYLDIPARKRTRCLSDKAAEHGDTQRVVA